MREELLSTVSRELVQAAAICAALFGATIAPSAHAGEEITIVLTSAPAGKASGIPVREMLSCKPGCVAIQPPVLFTHYKPLVGFSKSPGFNDAFTGHLGEAVDFSAEISADEHVQNVIVEHSIGSRAFVETVLASLKDATFAPATENGSRITATLRYRIGIEGYGSDGTLPPLLAERARQVDALLAQQKNAEAAALMDTMLSDPTLNFRQRAPLSLGRSKICLRVGDKTCALNFLRDATYDDGKNLGDGLRAGALSDRVVLEAQLGQYAEALAWFDILKTCCAAAADGPAAKAIDIVNTVLAKPEPLAAVGVVPKDPFRDTWHHTLFRRTFTFQHVTGQLDHFELRCNGRKSVASITDGAQWTVPDKWSACEIYVFGAPNASFDLVEVN